MTREDQQTDNRERAEAYVTALKERRRADLTEMLTQSLNNLTPLQRRFLIEYLSQSVPNATQAYKDAGGTATHADRAAHKIRHHPDVVAAIDQYFHAQEMSPREVVARLSDQARATYAHYLEVGPRGRIKINLEQLIADGFGHLVKRVAWQRTGRDTAEQVVEFYDAQAALEKVGRYHTLFKDKIVTVDEVTDLSDEELDDLANSL